MPSSARKFKSAQPWLRCVHSTLSNIHVLLVLIGIASLDTISSKHIPVSGLLMNSSRHKLFSCTELCVLNALRLFRFIYKLILFFCFYLPPHHAVVVVQWRPNECIKEHLHCPANACRLIDVEHGNLMKISTNSSTQQHTFFRL